MAEKNPEKRKITDDDIADIVRIMKTSDGDGNTCSKYDFTDEEIANIARIMKENNGINIHIPDSKFNIEFLRTNIRFNRDESIYKINVDKNVLQTFA